MKVHFLLVLFTWAISVSAHSWLDCVNVTNPTTVTNLNNMKCSGYPRGYVGRSNPDANMWKIEGMSTTSTTFYNYAACRTTSKTYTSTYPMLKLKAGEKMTIAYTPNGHTMWHQPPPPNGPRDMWVKWSGVANKELTTMQEVMNAQTLLQVQFDTPCHNRVTGAELDSSAGICQADVTIPAGTPAGTYQLVWWWPFRYSGTVVEDYTTCWDVEVSASSTSTTGSTSSAAATSSSATSSSATSASGSSSSSGSSTSGSSTGSSGEIVILTRVPTVVTPTSVFNITVGYVAAASRDIVVDLLDNVNYYSWGRGVVTVPAGKGSETFSIRVQNGPTAGSQYFFHAWTIGAGMANVNNIWNSAYDEHSVNVAVGNQLTFTNSC